MIRSAMGVLAVLALAAGHMGCVRSDGPPLYPVHGKVLYKGQPAVGAVVTLRREGAALAGTEALGPLVPTGQADEEGNFALAVDDFGEGAPVGQYKALIQWRVRSDEISGSAVVPPAGSSKKKSRAKVVRDKPDGVPDLLDGRFMKPESSRFLVEVKAEENRLAPFDVSN